MSATAEEKAHAEKNGVLRVGKRGRGLSKFQFADDGPVVEIDVIEVYDAYIDLDWSMREEGLDQKMILKATNTEYGGKRQAFVQEIVTNAYARLKLEGDVPTVTRAEAEDFVELVREEAKRLRNFTSKKTENDSSSPESSVGTEIRFSQ